MDVETVQVALKHQLVHHVVLQAVELLCVKSLLQVVLAVGPQHHFHREHIPKR